MIDLVTLEDALEGGRRGRFYLFPDTDPIVCTSADPAFDDADDEDYEPPDFEDALPIDPVDSSRQFQWMEDFIDTVHSITAANSLRNVLRHKRPFRHFRDALLEFPVVRQKWFQFREERLRAEALSFIERLGWEVLEVKDHRQREEIPEAVDPADRIPITGEERDWLLRGAWKIAAKGGRTQLALLLKGSKSKSVLKHGLDRSPVYGRLSYLTIPEIESRVDKLIRTGALLTEFFGDLPLILLPRESWLEVRQWAHECECRQAAASDARSLDEILLNWRHRKREEQYQLLDALASIDHASRMRVLEAWREVCGKEVRVRIDRMIGSTIG